jgi:hypothetical protein
MLTVMEHTRKVRFPRLTTHFGPIRHWFSVMGTFLPFEIITYAI